MNRRAFLYGGLTGIGLVALAGRSKSQMMPPALIKAGRIVPKPPPPPPLLIQANLRFGRLLDRARDALDLHQQAFELRDRVAIVDFTKPSSVARLHIVDLIGGQTSSYLVAHGKGSDPLHSGYLQSFSNVPDSFATSEGAYKTGPIYYGRHGPSMRLVGLDPTNSNADIRAIVVHSAPYVTEDHVAAWGKIGRSDGCFVVAPHFIAQVLALVGPGRLLFAAKL